MGIKNCGSAWGIFVSMVCVYNVVGSLKWWCQCSPVVRTSESDCRGLDRAQVGQSIYTKVPMILWTSSWKGPATGGGMK